MATYTTTADANGDFTVPFSSNYKNGQKITVTAAKDGATKSIELYAPSGLIQPDPWFSCSGNLSTFPENVGTIILKNITGVVQPYAFYCPGAYGGNLYEKATGLDISKCAITVISSNAFAGWMNATSLVLCSTITEIADSAFISWTALASLTIPNSVSAIRAGAFQNLSALTALTLGSGLTTIGDWSFGGMTSAVSVTCLATTPPVISSNTFNSIKSTVKYYVPAASLAAYKAAPIWKTFASKIYAIP